MDRKFWVKARYNCTQEYIFNQLVGHLERDVRQFNDLQEKKNPKGKRFFSETTPEGIFRILPGKFVSTDVERTDFFADPEFTDNPDHIIEVFLRHNTIVAQCGSGHKWKWEITTRWCAKDLECKYYLKGKDKPWELCRISQLILGDFMFEWLDR